MGRAGVRLDDLAREVQPEPHASTPSLIHQKRQVTQPQFMVCSGVGVKIQPVGTALFALPVGDHHLPGSCESFPEHPLAEIALPPGPYIGVIVAFDRPCLGRLIAIRDRAECLWRRNRPRKYDTGGHWPKPGPGLQQAERKPGLNSNPIRTQIAPMSGMNRQSDILRLA